MSHVILPPRDSTICSLDEMTRMVEGPFEEAVRIALRAKRRVFSFYTTGSNACEFYESGTLDDSPETIMARVDDMHARLVEEASKRMRKFRSSV